MSRRLQRWRQWALVLGIFVVGIPAAAASVVRTRATRERLAELATDALRGELGLEARVGSIRLELLPLTVVAQDLTLDDPVYGRFAEAGELRIQPSFRSLLRGALDLNEIELRGAEVRLLVQDGALRNLPRPPEAEPSAEPGPLELPFDTLRVVDSRLIVDANPVASARVEGLAIEVSRRATGIGIHLATAGGAVRHRLGEEPLQELEGDGRLEADGVVVDRLSVGLGPASVTLSDARLALPLPSDPADLEVRGQIEAAYELAHLLDLPFPEGVNLPASLEGRTELRARVASGPAGPFATGVLELTGGRIEQFRIGQRTALSFRADEDGLDLLEGSVLENVHDGGLLHLQGRLDFAPGLPASVSVRIEDLSFAKLMDDLGVTDGALVEWIFDGTGSLAGTLDPLDLEGPIRTQTRDFIVTRDAYHAVPQERVISVSRASLDARWSIRPDAFRFNRIRADLPRSRLRGDVVLGFQNDLYVRAHSEGGDLADIAPLDRWDLQGTGSVEVTIDGTFQVPRLRGHLRFDDFVFHSFRLGTVESDAELDPDGLGVRFPMVQAIKGDSRYRAEDLYLDFRQNRFEMTSRLLLDALQLADLYEIFGYEEDERFTLYQGWTRGGRVDLRYTNGFPGDLPSGTLDLELETGLEGMELTGYAFERGRMQARFRWTDWDRGLEGAELDVPYAELFKGDGTLTLDGRMRFGGRLDFHAFADRLALRTIEGIGDQLPGVGGVATAHGRVGGTLTALRGDFDVGLTNVTYRGTAVGDARAYVRLTDTLDPWVREARGWIEEPPPETPCTESRRGLAFADWPADPPLRTVEGPMPSMDRPSAFLVCGEGLGGRLRFDVAAGRTSQLPLRGRVLLDGLDVGPYLPEDAGDADGTVSATLTLTGGGLRALSSLAGSLKLPELRLRAGDVTVQNEGIVAVRFADGEVAVERARFQGPGSGLRVRGTASLDDGFALSIDSELDLALVGDLSDLVRQSGGRARAQLNVTGPIADPQLFGEATVEDGTFRLEGFAAPLTDLGGTVRFSQRSLLFEGFAADVAGGRVRLSGEASVAGTTLDRYRFDIEAEGLRYAFYEGVDVAFGAEAALSWSTGQRVPLLAGNLVVDRFEYTRPIELRSLGDVAASAFRGAFRQARTSVEAYDPDDDVLALDLRVRQQAPFRIRNDLVSAEVRIADEEGPFRILGTNQRYGVLGRMTITRGRVFFQNNDFDIRRGAIRFDDATHLDPQVDVEALTEIRRSSDLSAPSWRVSLLASGTAENLRLETRSEPELPQPDILMLLAFGMTRGELQALGGGEALAQSAALEALTAVTGVDREVSRFIPLVDDVRLTTGYSARTGRSEPRISIGSRITERVRISATTGLSESREFRAAAEWQLDDQTRLQASYDNYNVVGANSFGNLGLDVVFRLEFE